MERTLIVRTSFAAAHRLGPEYGECANVHGHTWRLEVELLHRDRTWPFMDFRRVKELLRLIVPDHQDLNQWPELKGRMPTSEAVIDTLWLLLHHYMPNEVFIARMRLWETPDCSVEIQA